MPLTRPPVPGDLLRLDVPANTFAIVLEGLQQYEDILPNTRITYDAGYGGQWANRCFGTFDFTFNQVCYVLVDNLDLVPWTIVVSAFDDTELG